MVDLVSVCAVKKKRKGKRWREKEEREKQITVTVGALLGTYFSNYSYRRAPAGELISALQLQSGPSQELEM